MMPNETNLWQKINNFNLDDPDAGFSFSARLARENGWSTAYTHRVVAEYKKLLFLCYVSDTGVTPSDPVDQAWHLHLTYTRSYWIDLCRDTLERDLHHNPTKGGDKEAVKFDGFYTATYKLYAEKFGYEPPADIWQDNQQRFTDINFRRVNVGRYWLIKKPTKGKYAIGLSILVLVSSAFIQASFTDVIPYIAFIGILGFGCYLIYLSEESGNRGDNKNSGDGGCSDGGDDGWFGSDSSHGHGHNGGDSGCGSGCSGCSSGCSGCGGGGD